MKLKKFFKLVLVFILSIICCMPMVGCSNCAGEDESTIFNPLNRTLELYEPYTFEVLEGVDKNSVDWEIVKGTDYVVLENDTVFAIGLGEFTIKATYGDQEQSQKVTIKKGDLPVISVEDLPLLVSSKFTIDPVTKHKEKVLNDIRYELHSSNEAVVAVDGLTLSTLTTGQSTITVNAFYKDILVSSATFVCTVNGNQGIIPNKAEYKLYLCDVFLGESFDKELPLQGVVYKDGALIENTQIEWTIADEDVAQIENGKIKAISIGKTTVKGVCSLDGLVLETVNIPVFVNTAIIESDEPIIIDLSKDTFSFSNTIFGVEEKVGVMINDESMKTYNLSNNQISTNQFLSGEYNFTIYSENNAYGMKTEVVIANYVVSDLETLKGIYKYENAYIAMANDVVINGSYQTAFDDKVTFTGTFNGLGHKIVGMTINKGNTGLFYMTDGATIKNVGFVDAKITSGDGSGILCYQKRGALTVDNVYIDMQLTVSSSYSYNGGVVGLLFGGTLTMNNSIIVCEGLYSGGAVNTSNGALVGRCTGAAVLNNSYIITDGMACSLKPNENNTQYEQINSLKGIYASESEFLADKGNEYAGMDFSGFNQKYWDLTNVPMYK